MKLLPAGWERQAESQPESASAKPAGGRAGQASPGAFRSRHRKIGEGEVVKERFIGPLAGVVSRQVIGRIGRRIQPGTRTHLWRDIWQTPGKHESPKRAKMGLGRLKDEMHNVLTSLGIL
jgi:hypothetical protein